MVILPLELKRFESLLVDIEKGRLPSRLAFDALQAFFAENPHLLMLDHFDEHEQNFLDGYETEALKFLMHGLTVQFERFNRLPQLRYRSPAGRWATLLQVPDLDRLDYTRELLFRTSFDKSWPISRRHTIIMILSRNSWSLAERN